MNTSSTYNAARLLTWLHYTAATLQIGAKSAQAYTDQAGTQIEPSNYTVHIEQTEQECNIVTLLNCALYSIKLIST